MKHIAYLKKIWSIKEKLLTLREVDIISCLLSGEGTKSLSRLLHIEEKTFRTHWFNLKKKYVFFSKESLIQYLQENGQRKLFLDHYLFLHQEKLFLKNVQMKDVLKAKRRIDVLYSAHFPYMKLYAELIKRQFDSLGINSKIIFDENVKAGNVVFFDFIKKENHNFLEEEHTKNSDFFYDFVDILKKMNFSLHFDEIGFEKDRKSFEVEDDVFFINSSKYNSLYKNYPLYILIFIGFCLFYDFFSKEKFAPVKIIPKTEENFLQREPLLQKIKNRLKKKCKINYCALVGIKGSGKTTLSRLYATGSSFPIIAECDAQSFQTLERSYFDLAYSISRLNSEREEIQQLSNIVDSKVRISQLSSYIQKKLKNNGPWLLIFDNVNDYKEIELFIPMDYSLWGSGNVIFTSCNMNVPDYVDEESCLFVGELSNEEAVSLFQMINKNIKIKEAQDLLSLFHPFALDIKIIAHYLKKKRDKWSFLLSTDCKIKIQGSFRFFERCSATSYSNRSAL
ncbi:MAG: hypothetical protein HEEMFOPI_01564 [Holosporales bacterium]